MRLIDADELMETIRAHDYPLKSHFNSTDRGMFTVGIQQAVDEQPTVTVSPWHKVEEPPKENGKYVAINVKTKWWYEASYESGNWKAVDLFGQRWVVIHPTHWMSVELPKEDV